MARISFEVELPETIYLRLQELLNQNPDTTWKVIRGGKLEEDKDRDFGFI